MSSRRYVSTGFGPVSSAVGMFEPVTMTRSTVASLGALGEDDGFCANTFETSKAGSPTAAARTMWITPNELLAFLRMSFSVMAALYWSVLLNAQRAAAPRPRHLWDKF